MPKFSIIVPVYNVAPYLRECLDSVLAQTFPAWECLCVNDGSTDESGAILDEYAAKDPRFRVFHKPNGGVSSARNLALDNATGTHIVFIDSDDVISPRLFDVLRTVVQELNPDIIKYDSATFVDGDALPEETFEDVRFRQYDFNNISQLREWFRGEYTHYIWKMCYKKERITSIRFEKIPHLEDGLYNFMCLGYAQRSVCILGKLYFYRLRSDSVTKSITLSQLKSVLTSLKQMNETAKKWPFFNDLHNLVYKRIWTELGGFVGAIIRGLGKHDKRQGFKIYLNTLKNFYHQKGFHPNPIMQKIYCFAGFFSWRFVSIFFLRIPLIAKRHVVKILKQIGVKK